MYDTLVDLMHGDAELLRLAALRLLGLLLGGATEALQPPPAIWSRVTHALGGAALSATTYSALMDTLVGKPQSVTLDPTTLPAERVYHPQLLGTILQLLPTAAYPLQRQALIHLTQLCRAYPSNCDALLELPGWQRWLLQLLLPSAAATPAAEGSGGGGRGDSSSGSSGLGSGRHLLVRTEHILTDGGGGRAGEQLLPMLQRLLQVPARPPPTCRG